MYFTPSTLSKMLTSSAGTYDFTSIPIKAFISTEPVSYPNIPIYKSDFDPTRIIGTSELLQNVGVNVPSSSFLYATLVSLTSDPTTFNLIDPIPSPGDYWGMFWYKDVDDRPILFYTLDYGYNTLASSGNYTFNTNCIAFIIDGVQTSFFYRRAREKLFKGSLGNLTQNLKVAFMLSSYVPNVYTHQYYSDISAYVLTTKQLSNLYAYDGALICPQVITTDSNVTGTTTSIIIYKDTGNPSTSPIICYYSFTAITATNKKISIGFNDNTLFDIRMTNN